MSDKEMRLAAQIHDFVSVEFADRVNTGRDAFGVRWGPHMSYDDPYSDFYVVDEDGVEYRVDIDVTVWNMNELGGTRTEETD